MKGGKKQGFQGQDEKEQKFGSVTCFLFFPALDTDLKDSIFLGVTPLPSISCEIAT